MVILYSCDSSMNDTLGDAGFNRTELLEVIDYYSESDSLRRKAASFLIANLKDHSGVRSQALDSVISFIQNSDTIASDKYLETMWKSLAEADSATYIDDTKLLSAKDLIDNIDYAFDTWNSSPWKADVNFNTFCEYILPHRVLSEMFSPGWREILRKEYSDIIAGETDLLRAYARVHCEVMKRFRNHSLGIPYVAPLKDLGKFGTGSCIQGCVYETAVMRALGIPAAIDGIDVWSNYSVNGHAWCALVTDNATYTMTKHDTIASIYNIIDSSAFPSCHGLEDNYPYTPSFRKRASKISRHRYSQSEVADPDPNVPDSINRLFTNTHREDVTKEYYKVNHRVILRSKYKGRIYLNIWRTNYGWYPVAYADSNNGDFVFENLGDSIVYLPVVYHSGEVKALTNPLLVEDGKVSVLDPKGNETLWEITIDRKYPLVGKFIDRWIAMRGGRFEGSDTPAFNNPATIAEITTTPIYRNLYIVNTDKAYRYIRYISPGNINFPITEIEVHAGGKMLKGIPFSTGIDNPERASDDDRFKILENATPGYTVGLDLRQPMKVDSIIMYPQNDDNFVIPGNSYELFYYDRGWKSLGKTTSAGYSVTYRNVPSNALLLLHCHNVGHEERIFTFEDGIQMWW